MYPLRSVYLLTVLLAITVTALGALTRLTDSGLGCPDWPGCYGQILAPKNTSALIQAQNAVPTQETLSPFNAWMEMIHRYAAGLLLITTLSLVYRQYKHKTLKHPLPLYSASVLIFLQAALGMWTVTMTLRPVVVTAHLIGGLSILSLLWLSYLRSQSPGKTADQTWPISCAIFLLFIQIFLGAWTSSHYATLACPNLPFCQTDAYQSLIQAWQYFKPTGQADFQLLSPQIKAAIQQWHRLGASLVGTYLTILAAYSLIAHRTCKKTAITALLLIITLMLQIALGFATVLFEKPLYLAWAHHIMASLLLLLCITLLHFRQTANS